MKRLLLFAALLLINIAGFPQKESNPGINPPSIVKKAFEKAFPGSTKIKWEKEAGDYEVNFVQNGHNMSAVYDTKAVLKETEQEIKMEELPLAVIQYIQLHHATAKNITGANIIKLGTIITYEVEVNETDLIFDAAGKFIKEEKD